MNNFDIIEETVTGVKNATKFIIKSMMWVIVWQTINTILIAILFFMVWGLYQ